MNDFDAVIQRYLDTWNETDTDKRAALVEELWAADGRYVDPIGSAEGHAALTALIGAVQQQFDGMRFELAGDIDAHHDQARFTWALGPAGDDPLVIGFDVLERDPDGKVRTVLGFLDKVPTA
ncbi:SnoaL-like protein [Rhodococcus sp. OK519]|uniref:nuclear transport factor 2 family protein n=1 Tax=Rhodococcus sp. OK519 TaxID=2135729 RepID=UPI000D3A583E|nr:SnoaL-like protein [Rhodococcus sp. OK519]